MQSGHNFALTQQAWDHPPEQRRVNIHGGTFIGGNINYVQPPNCQHFASDPATIPLGPPVFYGPRRPLDEWTHRRSAPADLASIPFNSATSSNGNAVVGTTSASRSEYLINNLTLVHHLAQQTLEITETARFILPTARILSRILAQCQEVTRTEDMWNKLVENMSNLAGDVCATLLRMKEANHSHLIQRLKLHFHKHDYTALTVQFFTFISPFNSFVA
ncbi:hypothetical protein B0H13DRAFT_246960 [Mycena leptocephala]|nr:hypothetical protein B0H13DRAFT_246960 [Mycena leptocephala]